MASKIVTFRVDEEVAAAAQKKAKRMGISMSAVLSKALRDFNERKNERVHYGLSPEEIEEILQADRDAEAGENISFVTHTKEEARAYLESLRRD